MKSPRRKLPTKKVLLPATEAPAVPNTAPAANAVEDDDDNEARLVRTSYAAYRLGVSENTARLYAKEGRLKAIRIGRTVRITLSSLLRLMEAAE